ncbi:MAG: ATP-binding protein [Bacteroidia bacterium]|nr:ATP-binding protein [Bacteroidia bacterium]
MHTTILTILTVILVECAAFGQTVLPPVFEIKSDTAYVQNIGNAYYQMLEDKSGKLTIQEVSSLPLSDKFHDRNEKSSTRDTLSNTYWFRYRLKNSMGREAKIALNSVSEYDDFYLAEPDGKWKHFMSGKFNDWDKKDGLKKSNFIPLVLQPDEERFVYQRIHNKKVGLKSKFAIVILGTERAIKQEYIDYVDGRTNYFGKLELQETFLLGLLFLAIFFNLFFYRFVREKVYLYFALFSLFLGINRLLLVLPLFISWEYPSLNEYLGYLTYAWAFIPYFLIQFYRQFFQTKARYPRWDKWLFGLAILNIIVNIIQFFHIMHAISFFWVIDFILTLFIIPLSIIVTLLLFIRSPDKSVRFIIIGSFPLMLYFLLPSPFYLASELKIINGLPSFLESENWLLELICITWLVLSFSWILFMRYDRLIKENARIALDKERLAKEKEIEKNELIARQKTDLEQQVSARTADLKQSLENLKSTQAQLIQSEKMASLGELTAGIAHEIQNPLNFVNNFSEVNSELIGEMEEEIDKGNLDEAKKIAKDIWENQQKINLHGKRADSIVKGMLQHSRSSSGLKEPTDINVLTDEFLRLSYHGLRAKDKTFNVSLKTNFDSTIGKINVVTEEIGRVILNLLNNAFYAVTEKKRMNPEGYEPTVSVSTQMIGDKVEILVHDNGNGIPQKELDKIFQPFFTTKPTGQGTGLGLSLSYDIVKAHGGEIKVESAENEGTEFIVAIPLIA